LQKIDDWQNVDRAVFENEIYPANRPAVLRGFLRDWPAVQAGRESQSSMVDYLKRFDNGGAVTAMVGPPEIKGRFFYSDDYQSFNFGSKQVSISSALDTIVSLTEESQPPAIALQALNIPELIPTTPNIRSSPRHLSQPRRLSLSREMLSTSRFCGGMVWNRSTR
jgi:hypothetical protein